MTTRHPALWITLALAAGCAEGKDPPDATPVVPIAGGSFEMGRAEGDACRLFETDDELAELRVNPRAESARVVHSVGVQRFCIDAHEVTVRQYDHCQQRGDCPSPELTNAGNQSGVGFVPRYYVEPEKYGDHPMLGVSWDQARAYCAFRGGRLPTEAEWEYVASSRGARSDRIWADAAFGAVVEEDCEGEAAGTIALGACSRGTAPVGESPADQTAQGVFDMAGNAAEWVADEFDYFAGCDPDQPGGRLDELFFVEGGRPLPIPDPGFIAADAGDRLALAPDGGAYTGGCIDDFNGCADRCGLSFGAEASNTIREREWQAYTCGARFGLSPRQVDVCRADDTCADEVEACFDTPPTAPADGGDCLRRCQGEVDRCLTGATVDGVSAVCVQFESNENCRPVPWCRARSERAAEVAHLRPDALGDDTLRGAHTVRGGHFQTTAICQATPTWRDFRATGSPVVGFRCAYDAGTRRCPAN